MKHTELPWTDHFMPPEDNMRHKIRWFGRTICLIPETGHKNAEQDKANAEYIVKTANFHHDLVKVAQYFKELTDNPDDFDDDNGMPTTEAEERSEFVNTLLKKLGEL